MKYRDLEKVRKIIDEATGLEISYAYDDLVFPDYTAFILRYDDNTENNFFCHFHQDVDPEEMKKLKGKLEASCKNQNSTLSLDKYFTLNQKGEEVEIQFI
ncbi:MAG: hypothetical protein JW801_01520 [Bacteroidales bacterium]|nr:hypothetical protein [Bacteroidales bacterium]